MSDTAAQIEFWNGPAGETWVRAREQMDAQGVRLVSARWLVIATA